MVVDPNPPLARHVPKGEIHPLPGDQARGFDGEYVQPETVRIIHESEVYGTLSAISSTGAIRFSEMF